jgi:hypothetical protein
LSFLAPPAWLAIITPATLIATTGAPTWPPLPSRGATSAPRRRSSSSSTQRCRRSSPGVEPRRLGPTPAPPRLPASRGGALGVPSALGGRRRPEGIPFGAVVVPSCECRSASFADVFRPEASLWWAA